MNELEAPDTERTILGTILQYSRAYQVAADILNAEDFADEDNRRVFLAMNRLDARGVKIDLMSVLNNFRETEREFNAGHLSGLPDVAGNPHAESMAAYCEAVRDLSIKRKLDRLMKSSINMIGDRTVRGAELADDLMRQADEITASVSGEEPKGMPELVPSLIKWVETQKTNGGRIDGVESGLATLDRIIGGFKNSEFTVIGARPSVGKTALVLTILLSMSCKRRIPSLVFSLEMSNALCMERVISSHSGVAHSRIKNGWCTDKELETILASGTELYDAPIFIDDDGSQTIGSIRRKTRSMIKSKGIRIVFIDYFSLIQSEDNRIPRHEQMAGISKSLKLMAKEFGIPVVVLSQLKREKEGQRPGLADLRETGSIEEDADIVAFLHRERMEEADKIPTEIIIAKNRNGPIGTAHVDFQPKLIRFTDQESSGNAGKE